MTNRSALVLLVMILQVYGVYTCTRRSPSVVSKADSSLHRANMTERSATQLGRSLVGVRVSVWWEEDEVWYDGTIRAFDDVMGEHLVAYDDGDQVHEVLDKCRCACCAIGGYAIGGCWCARRASLAHYRLCFARAPLLWCPQVEDGPWWHEDSTRARAAARAARGSASGCEAAARAALRSSKGLRC